MPYFSGPNGIREVADAGERFQQSFQDSRKKRLLSDYFRTGNVDLGALGQLDPQAAQQIQAQQKQSGLAKMFADLYAAPEAERPKGIAALLAQDPVMGQQAMERFDPRFQRQNAELAPRVVGNALVDSTGKVLFQAPERTEYQWSDRAGAWIPKPGAQGFPSAQPQPQGSPQPFNVNYDGPPEGRAAFEAAIRQDQAMGSPPGNYTINTPMPSPQSLRAIPVDGVGPNTPPPKFQSRQYAPQEVAAMGLPPGTVAYTSEDGTPKIVSKPDAASQQYTPQQRLNAQKVLQAAGKQQANIENIRTGLVRMRKALNALNTGMPFSTGTGLLQGRISALGPEGQELQSAVGAIQNSMLALTRVPGVGTQSDRDSIVDERRYPSLTVDKSVNENTMKQLEDFAANLLGSFETETRSAQEIARGGQPQQQAPAGGGYRVGQIIQQGGKRYRVTGGDPNDPDVEEVR